MIKRIGFIGCYSHDVILMLARALCCMGKTVLLRDSNLQHTLHASVPVPEEIRGKGGVLEYDGFLFTEQRIGTADSEECDIELVDFGMDGETDEFERCSELVVITDMLPHHVCRLEKVQVPKELVTICIVRDSFEAGYNKEQEIGCFLHSFSNKQIFYLPTDVRDIKNRYVCETLHEYNINKASSEMRDMIYRLVGMFCPEYSEKEIRRNIKQRERGHYR